MRKKLGVGVSERARRSGRPKNKNPARGIDFRAASRENRDFRALGHFGRVLRQGENAVLHHFKWKFKNEWSFCAWAIHNYFFALNVVF